MYIGHVRKKKGAGGPDSLENHKLYRFLKKKLDPLVNIGPAAWNIIVSLK